MSQRTRNVKGLRKKLRRNSGIIVRESWKRTMEEPWYMRAKLAARLVPELWAFLVLFALVGAALVFALLNGLIVLA